YRPVHHPRGASRTRRHAHTPACTRTLTHTWAPTRTQAHPRSPSASFHASARGTPQALRGVLHHATRRLLGPNHRQRQAHLDLHQLVPHSERHLVPEVPPERSRAELL